MSRIIPIRRFVALTLALFGLCGAASAQDKPDLVLVSVGVSKFHHRPYERGVVAAAKDALDVARAYQEQEGRTYRKVHSRVLTDERATRANIETVLAWARKQANKSTHVVVFMASHGGPNALGQYSFTPHDANPLLPSTSVTSAVLRKHLHDMPGKCFLILDTCFAGGCNRFGGVNFITLAACSHQQVSDEVSNSATGNGLFTRTFLEAFRGMADSNRDGTVSLDELDRYVSVRLENVTRGKQRFTMHRPTAYAAAMTVAHVESSSTTIAGRDR